MNSQPQAAPPVLVNVTRGSTVESRHRGAYVISDASGRVLRSAGDIEAPVFPRSAVKPLQALPLVESGAADRFGLTQRELALACASHRGEPAHVEAVGTWLGAIGLSERDLECGAHPPTNPDAARALAHQDVVPNQMHNNCSGKHTGFLCTAVHMGEPTGGYIRPDHPVQRRVAAVLGEMTGVDVRTAPCGCDGCGIPTYALPLRALARGMARMADPSRLPPDRAQAAARLLDAMASQPFFVSGTGTFVTTCMAVAGRTTRVKTGAEGVYVAALPTLGLGIALKIEDGASRAAEFAMATLLRRLGCLDAAQERALAEFLAPPVRNVAGEPVGRVQAAPGFPG